MLTARYKLSKIRLLHLLEELKSNSIEVGSLCMPPKSSLAAVKNALEKLVDNKSLHQDIAGDVAESPTGAILFWGPHHRYLVMPPFPVDDERFSNTCEIDPLYSLLHREFLFGLVVVRLGSYGIGVVKGGTLVSSKVGTGLVHARHRQGGSSSHRFERHRLKQMETFFTNVCEHAREQLEPYGRQLEYLIYGGTRQTLLDFRKQCHFLSQFDTRTIDILLNIREPKHSGIEEAVEEAWSSRVIEWKD
jgi:peptide subunit release factor 1 (eRF1)